MADKRKILVVEDESDFRMMLRARLEANGYEVSEAVDGVDGLAQARDTSPDLIMLDIMMPKIDGYELAHLLKFDKKCRNIPIVMLTVRSQKADQETGMTVGADAYLVKPCNSEDILKVVTGLLAKQT